MLEAIGGSVVIRCSGDVNAGLWQNEAAYLLNGRPRDGPWQT
jgi:hypothetical protein